MENMYWISEYGKVLAAYIFLMFIWPFVVFRKLLRGKSLTFQVCFCPTCSVVMINTVVLFLGLFHILNKWTVWLFFYGIFAFYLLRLIPFDKKYISTLQRLFNKEYGLKMFLSRARRGFKVTGARFFRKIWGLLKPHLIEYLLLFILILYGMIYFSWGAFQDYSYGFSDINVHHSWIYNLTQGKIFSSGVYPEGMHCFIYSMHTLFGIKIYSCNLFLGAINIIMYLLSIYCMFKEVFHWRGSILLALALFLIVRPGSFNAVYSMSRLQCTLPQEFGFFTQFLCVVFFVRFLESNHHPKRGRKVTKRVWDENLLVFALALSASISTHFYVTIMAFFLCMGFLAFSLRKTFRKTHFLPLVTAAVLGVAISVIPMAGALMSGIPFQGSIGWAMNIIKGTDGNEDSEQDTEQENEQDNEQNDEQNSEQNSENLPSASDTGSAGSQATVSSADGTVSNSQTPSNAGNSGDMITENATEQITAPKENIIAKCTRILKTVFTKLTTGVIYSSYYLIYPKLGKLFVLLSVLSVIMLAAYKAVTAFIKKNVPDFELDPHILDRHACLLLASYIFMLMHAAPSIGLPQLIDRTRLLSTIHLLLLAVVVLPLDLLFSVLAAYFARSLMNVLSLCALAASCFLVVKTGYYHGYMFYSLIRYNSAVDLVAQIVETYPQYTYTIISPTDELYQVIQYGRHTDLYEFMNHTRYDKEYYIPTEYVFIFVEKKALQYAQYHFFHGPAWLAQETPEFYASYTSQCPDIISTEISAEKASELYHATRVWYIYTHMENRVILESRAYLWCQDFAMRYTYETEIFYENDDFICYRIHQNPQRLFNMVIE